MVIACIINFMIRGSYEEHLATGKILKYQNGYYYVDFSNAAEGLDAKGDYRNVRVSEVDCIAKSLK